jgi:hypothetical protein
MTGVSSTDFDQIYNDFYRTVSYEVVTKTEDPVTDSEILTYAAASNVNVVFFVEDNKYLFDKEGLLEVGDAYIMAKTSVGIKRYDRFTLGNRRYLVKNVINRYVLNTAMMDFGVCFIEGDA